MPDPFTIHIFVPMGIQRVFGSIDLMHWTGKGIVFPRAKMARGEDPSELAGKGNYISVGAGDDEDNALDDDAQHPADHQCRAIGYC